MPTTNQQRRAKYYKRHPEVSREWYKKNVDKVKNYNLEREFGITIEQYRVLQEVQNNVCAICRKPESIATNSKRIKSLAVDHNHRTGKIRGLLCHKCNVAIGLVEEKVETLEKIIGYLKCHAD